MKTKKRLICGKCNREIVYCDECHHKFEKDEKVYCIFIVSDIKHFCDYCADLSIVVSD
jgi:hypothetical protein